MKIIEAGEKEKNLWNSFVLDNQGEFLQSWEWGDFKQSVSNPSTSLPFDSAQGLSKIEGGARKIWRLAVLGNEGEIMGIALIIRHDLPFGKNYLYCPKGPVIHESRIMNQESREKLLSIFLNKIKEIAQKENSVFLKVESGEEKEGNLETKFPSVLGNLASKHSTDWNVESAASIQPKSTLILDITKTEEQLLAEMKQKTRYNIRLAEKHGVKVRISDKKTFTEDFEKFWRLTEETAKRDKIKAHPKGYYKKMLESLPFARLFLAEFQGGTLAANIVIFFGNRAIYLHGASSSQDRHLMAPYLLQWEQIKKARKSGCKEYDFWGITKSQISNLKSQNFSNSNYKPSWLGITRFKTGFGGREVNYPEAIDFIYQPIVYNAIRITKKIKIFF